MDDFVRNKLTEWELSELEERFEANKMKKDSLFCLTDDHISKLIPEIGLQSIFIMRLNQLKKGQNTFLETADFSAQVQSKSVKGKRQSALQGESIKCQPPTKRQRCSETRILAKAKDIMKNVKEHINVKEQLGAFLKNKISDLEIDKRELVGVFGRTGAGKSSLINAIIDEPDLLPTGIISACTTVVIKVEANTCSSKYEAEIEFITKEEWEHELLPLITHKKDDDDYHDMVKKLSALYGEEWKGKCPETLLEKKYFKNIPEFLESIKKSLECDTAKELSVELVKYTECGSKQDENKTQKWYWPLVKCVTVRVPECPLLQHVTLVDLPGNGDRNRSRNEMWKQIVGDCSTVWIVAEITRPTSETEAWEILKSELIGNGGQCEQLHFICTKSDPLGDRVTRNKKAKELVMKEFQEWNTISKHFKKDCFEVFTVSADEFLTTKHVKADDNDIPKLRDFLEKLNDCHSETFNYVTGAHGILSLIEGARHRKEGVEKADDVCQVLKTNIEEQLDQVKKAFEDTTKDFEQYLTEGVKNSKTSEKKLKTFLDRDNVFKTLEAVVKKGGIHTTKKGEHINLNTILASCLTDSIDEKFRKTFPNDVKGGSLKGVISRFSLVTKSMIQNYQDVKLQLIFLQTEEEKIKAKLNKRILTEKKIIYTSLTETIEKNMETCYEDAKKFTGNKALTFMRNTIETHVSRSGKMYEEAKEMMLEKMKDLAKTIQKELKETMEHSIKLSLKTDACSLPDVSNHLESVKKYLEELGGQDDVTGFQARLTRR